MSGELQQWGQKTSTTTGLTYGFYGGTAFNSGTGAMTVLADGTVALTNSATNYVERLTDLASATVNTTGFTAGGIPMAKIVTSAVAITSVEDWRPAIPALYYPGSDAGAIDYRYPIGDVRRYGAKGDGSTDDSAAIQAAIDSGHTVYFPTPPAATGYLANGLVQSTNGQTLRGDGGVFCMLVKNANGTILACSGDGVVVDGLCFRGDAPSPTYTGDNVTFSGNGCALINSGSRYAHGRAVKATGGAFKIMGTCDVFATADASATGYDVELGIANTPTLYHQLWGVYSSQSTGGILIVDGHAQIFGGEFGKLTIQRTAILSGPSAGVTSGCRILGPILVEQSNGSFVANQLGASATLTFGTNTSGLTFDESNVWGGATVTNNGNVTANLIRRRVSTGLSNTVQVKIGDDTNYVIVEEGLAASGAGFFKAPQIRIPNNNNYYLEQSSGAVGARLGMAASDFLFLVNDVTDKGVLFKSVGTGSGSTLSFDIDTTRRMVINTGGVTVPAGGLTLSDKTAGLKSTGGAPTIGSATLTAGTVTVSTTAITAASKVFLTRTTSGGTIGDLRVSATTAGTSFVVTSASGTDTSMFDWIIFEAV